MYPSKTFLSTKESCHTRGGGLKIKTYNPMKPDKYGVKFYFLCEAESGYVHNFSVYRGVSQSFHDSFHSVGGIDGSGIPCIHG